MAVVVTPVCFPEDDVVFVGQVRRLVRSTAADGALHAAVEALLRESYPLAVISPRQSMAAVDGTEVWYVFRDGGLARPRGDAT